MNNEKNSDSRSGASTIMLLLFGLLVLSSIQTNPLASMLPTTGEHPSGLPGFKTPFNPSKPPDPKGLVPEEPDFGPPPYRLQPADTNPNTKGMFGPGDDTSGDPSKAAPGRGMWMPK